jgi:hypothetical protein
VTGSHIRVHTHRVEREHGFAPGRRCGRYLRLIDPTTRIWFHAFIGLQVALSLVLLVGSLLTIRSLQRATVMELGSIHRKRSR